MRPISYSILPEHIQDGMKLYIERGIDPGDFCRACLSDRLVEAFSRADEINLSRMFDIAKWLYADCPARARGSEEIVARWMEVGGLRSIEAQAIENDIERY